MKTVVETLHALQQEMQTADPDGPRSREAIAALRSQVPRPVLGHFDRQMAQRRKGVALVRHGVCGECHIRVPIGTLVSLIKPSDVHVCEICGCYLLLAPDESPAALQDTAGYPRVRPARRKAISRRVKRAAAVP